MRIADPPAQTDASEWMDRPQPRPAMEQCLRDLARLNRLLGVDRLVLGQLRTFVRPGDRELLVADVATGGADLPRLFANWGAAHNIAVRTIGIDVHPTTARLASEWSAGWPRIRIVQGDARTLPLVDRAVDLAVCTTALHHLSDADAPGALRELDRVGSRGFIMTDLVRSWMSYGGARLVGWAFAHSPIIRADATISARRAYTVEEVEALVAASGVTKVSITRHPVFRVAVVQRK